MKTYKFEELTLSEARTLSGVLFHFTDKHTAVSENSLITLLTSAEEGFGHVLKSESFFIYREDEDIYGNKVLKKELFEGSQKRFIYYVKEIQI